MALSMFVAFLAACCFASGNAVQHRAAGRVPTDGGPVRLLVNLFHSPQWLVGSALALTAFLLHTTAMNIGVVAVVQPFMLGAVLLAVPIRAFLDRTWPVRRELLWVGITVAAIVVFVSTAHTQRSDDAPHDGRALVITLAGFVAALVWASLAKRSDRRAVRAFVFATASGVTFGITAGLMKFLRHDATDGLSGMFGHWHIYALLVGSVIGTTLNQRSYQQASLSVAMPAMNVVDIIVALAFGWVVFNEPPSLGVTAFMVQAICLVFTGLGLLQVARAEDELQTAQEAAAAVRDSEHPEDQPVRP